MSMTLGVACLMTVNGCTARDPAALSEALMDADRAFARVTGERGADGWASFFAADGVMIVPGREVRGPDQIRELMEQSFGDSTFTISWEPRRAEISAFGDLGYTVGRYETRRSDAGDAPITRRGTYVTIWKSNKEGTWRVVLDVGAPDPAN